MKLADFGLSRWVDEHSYYKGILVLLQLVCTSKFRLGDYLYNYIKLIIHLESYVFMCNLINTFSTAFRFKLNVYSGVQRPCLH